MILFYCTVCYYKLTNQHTTVPPTHNNHDTKTAEIQISEKDYFTRAMEFKVWLFHKKKYFEDLTSTESHDLFGKFVKDWNRCGHCC